jgi:hypothetical protein
MLGNHSIVFFSKINTIIYNIIYVNTHEKTDLFNQISTEKITNTTSLYKPLV